MSETASKLPVLRVIAALTAGALLFGLIFYGCNSRRELVVQRKSADTRDVCATLLQSGLAMARPSAMGLVGIDVTLQSVPDQAADQFTQWLRRKDCMAVSAAEPPSDEARSLLTQLLGENGAEGLLVNRADVFDAVHIRDALLHYEAADNITNEADSDLDRVLTLFDDVMRTISPQAPGTTGAPLMVYEASLFGRGTAEARACLFAHLLRQLRIDAVILRPESADSENEVWWVGVLLDEGVYLFDPTLGLPVPTAGEELLPPPNVLPQPATWAQVVDDPGLLVQYRRDAGIDARDVTAEQLAATSVELIGPRSYWKTAMERLELSMTEDLGVLLYDPLHDTQANPGYFRRVVEAGGTSWNADAIAIWPYPDEVRAARQSLTESQSRRLEQRIQKYLGPVEPDPQTGEFGTYRGLWQTRIEHLSGQPGAAIGDYVLVRLANAPHPLLSPTDLSLNAQAADEAAYWSAHAQYGMGEYAAAVETIDKYLSQRGDRADESHALRVLALAAQGKTDEAAAAVAELPETTSGLARLRWLASRWNAGAAPNEE